MLSFRKACGVTAVTCLNGIVKVVHATNKAMGGEKSYNGLVTMPISIVVTLPLTLPVFLVALPAYMLADEEQLREAEKAR